jgi:hypothetical protein
VERGLGPSTLPTISFYFSFEPVLTFLSMSLYLLIFTFYLFWFQLARSTLQNRLNFPTKENLEMFGGKRTNSLICIFVTLRFSNDLNGDSCEHPIALVNLT